MYKIYYDHRIFFFHKFIVKNHFISGYIYIYIYFSFEKFVIEFQNCGNKHDHGLLWIKNASMYGVHTN